MEKSYRHLYHVIRGSWGIKIELVASLVSTEEFRESTDAADENVSFSILPTHLSEEEQLLLMEGLQVAVSKASEYFKPGEVLVIQEVIYNPCDYQKEGLKCAAVELIENIAQRKLIDVVVKFNSERNIYEFDLSS